MKKLLIVGISLLFAVVSYGQNTIETVSNLESSVNIVLDLEDNETFAHFYGANSDTVSSTDSTWTYVYGVKNQFDAVKAAGLMKLDSVSGVPNTSITLQGKIFWDDDWTTVETETWAGSSEDTTLSFDYSTAKPYRFWRFNHDAVADSTQKYKIAEIQFKLYK